jgi:hypothetical protein
MPPPGHRSGRQARGAALPVSVLKERGDLTAGLGRPGWDGRLARPPGVAAVMDS